MAKKTTCLPVGLSKFLAAAAAAVAGEASSGIRDACAAFREIERNAISWVAFTYRGCGVACTRTGTVRVCKETGFHWPREGSHCGNSSSELLRMGFQAILLADCRVRCANSASAGRPISFSGSWNRELNVRKGFCVNFLFFAYCNERKKKCVW